MRTLEILVREFTPSDAIFAIEHNIPNSIRFQPQRQIRPAQTDPFKQLVSDNLQEIFRYDRLAFRINHDETVGTVRYKLCSIMLDFLRANIESPNPRLTTLFKWSNSFLNDTYLRREPQLEEDLINIYRYIAKVNTGSEEAKNGVKLLDFIKSKYEKKGLVYDEPRARRRRRY